VLVELSVMEQRYQAVLAVVQDGWKVTEVARRLGVSRQSVHNWIARYEKGRRYPERYAAVALTNLTAYDGSRSVAELDGCFIEVTSQDLRLTLVEAKRQNTGSRADAQKSLVNALRRLGRNDRVEEGQVSSERVTSRVARAWVTLEIS
jgi:transposase-like protein